MLSTMNWSGAGQSQTCELAGTKMTYYERGSGVPVVLVHGMFGDHLDWEPVLEPLSERFRVISIDLPGFGESSKSNDYTLEFFVEALEAFFSRLQLHGVVLVGNSLGGVICSYYAAAHPERLRGVVLVSSAGMRGYGVQERAFITRQFSAANIAAIRPEYVSLLFGMNFAQASAARDAYLERQRAKLRRDDYPLYAQALAQSAPIAFANPVIPVLAGLPLPMLLMWGDRDSIFPVEVAQAALPQLPHARLAIIAGAGHMPQMDQPQAFVELLSEFIDECKQAKPRE